MHWSMRKLEYWYISPFLKKKLAWLIYDSVWLILDYRDIVTLEYIGGGVTARCLFLFSLHSLTHRHHRHKLAQFIFLRCVSSSGPHESTCQIELPHSSIDAQRGNIEQPRWGREQPRREEHRVVVVRWQGGHGALLSGFWNTWRRLLNYINKWLQKILKVRYIHTITK